MPKKNIKNSSPLKLHEQHLHLQAGCLQQKKFRDVVTKPKKNWSRQAKVRQFKFHREKFVIGTKFGKDLYNSTYNIQPTCVRFIFAVKPLQNSFTKQIKQ